MFASRVKLLSDYAERYGSKAEKMCKNKGFWCSLFELLDPKERSFSISGTDLIGVDESELLTDSFAPFCEIDGRKFYFKKDQFVCQAAILSGNKTWDLSTWGADSDFIQRLIAECYFMVTRDDYRIDEDEQKVLQALIGYLEPTSFEINAARNMVYWTLIDKVIEDNLVTEEESDAMQKIREALNIDEQDVYELHTKALKDRYEELKQESQKDSQIDLMKLEQLKNMAEKMGISRKIFAELE
jgi:hypothetical protein